MAVLRNVSNVLWLLRSSDNCRRSVELNNTNFSAKSTQFHTEVLSSFASTWVQILLKCFLSHSLLKDKASKKYVSLWLHLQRVKTSLKSTRCNWKQCNNYCNCESHAFIIIDLCFHLQRNDGTLIISGLLQDIVCKCFCYLISSCNKG